MNIEALFKLSYGLYIVSSHDGGKLNGHISNTVFQVTAEPARIAVCSNKDNLTTDYIRSSKVFAVTVISEQSDLAFIGHFGFKSGREFDKFSGIEYFTGQTGAPIVKKNALAYFECEVEQETDLGTHVMFVGRMVSADVFSDAAAPLTYKYYREVIKGISPKNAPTYVPHHKEEAKLALESGERYKCAVCGYVYDSSKGDPDNGIAPGTSFDDLPEDWTCPICGVGKDVFTKE